MTTSSEDVLLQVPQVRYKKGDGTLFLMDQRLIWMVENRDTVALRKFPQKEKLKYNYKLCFIMVSRRRFILPIVDRELEEKNKLLSSNPALLQLYKDLVMTEVVSSEEFWAQHASQYTQKQKQQPQDIGVSGAFLADIKPQTDGCNGLKYNITPDIIECIFKTYPAVKKKYVENVPAKLSESQFWTKFFQSHYFHRDRKYAESKDLFTECGKIDDQEMKKDIQSGVSDPLVNITEFEDKTLDEGYGVATEKTNVNIGTVSQAMIKRFNQHSIMVLKATKKSSEQNETEVKNAPKHNGNVNEVEKADEGHVAKKQRIQSKITYDDLDTGNDNSNVSGTSLNLSKVERYLHGPMPDSSIEQLNPNEASTVLRGVLQETRQWQSRHPTSSLVSPAAAVGALGELSPGGALMRGFQEQSLAQLVPSDIENEVRNLYLALCELLSHFWKCFPPNTPNLEQKAVKMHEALHRYHTAKLKPFEDKLIRELSPLSHHLTKHLNQLLNAAYQKFSNWQKIKNR
ncbi:general transcription factor IIH subunit 1 [Asbolus verrucosus]|uniref:General transcription factor IIH subunit 1 n=1 Tax=Asbolus verrucosus TaxID=1661398 RepID=A0A482VLT8_ASBVE|nr:general transcription factor IIH subunit 1 [Asbolus verrucosus]